MTTRTAAATALVIMHAAACCACTVPVYRYALERWPADPHVVRVASNVVIKADALADHHANLWIERAGTGQTAQVSVSYADDSSVWHTGDWNPSLPVQLADSPLRRRIAHELLTGTAASFVLVESSDAATNAALHAMLETKLAELAREIEPPETLDYEDEADGWNGPLQGSELSAIPNAISFALHRVARDARAETFFVQQITGLDPAFASPATPVLAVVFGRGRMIPLAGEDLTPDVIEEVCWFLCSACSCRVKALNPGIDVLMAANWDEAIYAYPETVQTVLPNGNEFTIGGTSAIAQATEPTVEQKTAKTATHATTHDNSRTVLLLAVAGVVILAGVMLLKRP